MKLKDLLAEGARLKKAMSLKDLAMRHGIPRERIRDQISKGSQVEREHTTSNKMAQTIARHHIAELPDYYDRLQKMENEGKKDRRKPSIWSGLSK